MEAGGSHVANIAHALVTLACSCNLRKTSRARRLASCALFVLIAVAMLIC